MLPVSWGHSFFIGLRPLKRENIFCPSWITVPGWRQDLPSFWCVDRCRLRPMSYPFHVLFTEVWSGLYGQADGKKLGEPTGLDGGGRWIIPGPQGRLWFTSSVSHPACKEEASHWSCDGFPSLPSLCPWLNPISSTRRKQEQCHEDSIPFSHHLGTGDASFWTSLCLQKWGNSLDLNSQLNPG